MCTYDRSNFISDWKGVNIYNYAIIIIIYHQVSLSYHLVSSWKYVCFETWLGDSHGKTHIKGNQSAILSSSSLRYDTLEYAECERCYERSKYVFRLRNITIYNNRAVNSKRVAHNVTDEP